MLESLGDTTICLGGAASLRPFHLKTSKACGLTFGPILTGSEPFQGQVYVASPLEFLVLYGTGFDFNGCSHTILSGRCRSLFVKRG